MSMGGTDNVREYYRLVTEMDIGDVARELLPGRITQETGQRLMCDCPNHQSQSRLSLHVMLDKQGWYCFGCGSAAMCCSSWSSFRRARSPPAIRSDAGQPPSGPGLSRQRRRACRRCRAMASARASRPDGGRPRLRTAGQDALTALARLYHARLRSRRRSSTG